MMNAGEQITACVLRVRRKAPFFGALALFLDHVLDPDVPTACTDGMRVIFNPDFVSALEADELDAVMVHELLHAALLHLPRRRERDPVLWNMAADIVVNGIIRVQPGLCLPRSACTAPDIEKYEVEEVYEILLRRGQKHRMDWIGADLAASSRDEAGSEHTLLDLESRWQHAWHQAAAMDRTFAQGSMPQELARHMDGILTPLVDWRSLLWRFMVRTPVDFTAFDRRLIGQGIYLETLAGETVCARIAVDTSGSISREDLSQFLSEVREILRIYPHLDGELFYADAALHGPYELSEESMTRPRGGGGTSFIPFFESMSRRSDHQGNTVLIYLTDGHGTFPKQPPDQSVLWVVTPGGLPDESFPFGTVVRFLPLRRA